MARGYTRYDWPALDPLIEVDLAHGLTLDQIAEKYPEIGTKGRSALGMHLLKRKKLAAASKEEPMSDEMTEAPEVLPGQLSIDDADTPAEAEPMSAPADIIPVTIDAVMVDEIGGPLSLDEAQTLEHYEQIIAQGFKTFVQVGQALLAIRDQRLYRQSYATFEEYLRQRWDLSRPYAYQLMDASQVVQNLSAGADIVAMHGLSVTGEIVPANEAQARPLASLPPEQQREVWREAVETAPPSGITAKHVQATVKRHSGQQSSKPKRQEPQPRQPARKEVQDKLVGILKVIDDTEAWPVLATLWAGIEYHYRTRPNITESALAVCMDSLKRLIPLFPASVVESFQLGVEPRDLVGDDAHRPATE